MTRPEAPARSSRARICAYGRALARAGLSVLHLDRNGHYGGSASTFSLPDLHRWLYRHAGRGDDEEDAASLADAAVAEIPPPPMPAWATGCIAHSVPGTPDLVSRVKFWHARNVAGSETPWESDEKVGTGAQ